MPDQHLVAGIDVGTTNTKTGLYRVDGTRLALRSRPTYRDPDRLLAGVFADLTEITRRYGQPAAVGLASMAETGVIVDAALRPVHPLIRWDDPGGHDLARRMAAHLGAAEVFATTGVNLSAKTPLVRWRQLGSRRPDLLGPTRRWLGAADLVAGTLVGEAVTDLTLAGRTGVLDLRTGRYQPDLLAAAGIRAEQLPRVVEPGRTAGRVDASAAARAGLLAGTPVVVAGHDHLVAAHAAGIRDTGVLGDSLGTAEALVSLTDRPPAASAAGTGLSWNRYVDGSHHCLVSGFPGAGRLVDWFLARAPGTGSYDGFEALVDEVSRRPTGLLVEPYPAGRAAPRPDPHRTLRVHGTPGDAELAVALLEGACLHVRWMAEQHARLAEPAPSRTIVFGGPSRGGAWMRIKAAVGPYPLDLVTEPDTACAGAAQWAAHTALGVPPPPLVTRRIGCDAAESARYHRFYRHRFLPAVDTDAPPTRRTDPHPPEHPEPR